MKQIVLTPEQMKHLEELGLNTSDASMIWERSSFPNISYLTINHLKEDEKDYFLISYAYILQDILEKLNDFNRKYVMAHEPENWLNCAYTLLLVELTHK